MDRSIYLDHHATTPVDRRVLEAMLPYFCERFGNPSSRSHGFGWDAEEAVERARAEVARAVGCRADEILFTSGATESDNLALKGMFEHARAAEPDAGRNQIVVSAIEHPAVLEAARHLERHGARLTVIPVSSDGLVDLERLRAEIGRETLLVSVIAASNEIGTIQPLREIATIAHEAGALVHTDAAQAVGKIPFDVQDLDLDLVSFSAHKMYGPKGVGALYARRRGRRVRLTAQLDGGGHERGLRAGTLPVPLLVGFGAACTIAVDEMATEATRLRHLRDRLYDGLRDQLDELYLHGDYEQRLPGNLNLSFAWVEGESLIVGLKGIAVSSGSACNSNRNVPSHVLRAIGVDDNLAHTAIRFGIGRFNTEQEIDEVIRRTVHAVEKLRAISPLYEMHKSGVDPRTALG